MPATLVEVAGTAPELPPTPELPLPELLLRPAKKRGKLESLEYDNVPSMGIQKCAKALRAVFGLPVTRDQLADPVLVRSMLQQALRENGVRPGGSWPVSDDDGSHTDNTRV